MSHRLRGLTLPLAGLLAVTALLAGLASASDEELLEQIRVGMYERYHSFTSCKGSVHLVTTHPTDEGEKLSTVQVLTAAFDGERLRMSGKVQTGPAANFEGLYDGKTTTEWASAPDLEPFASVYDGRDGFVDGMFSLFVDPHTIGSYPVSRLDRWPEGSAAILGRKEIDGRECVVMEVESSTSRARLWVDVDRGFAVVKLRLWYVRPIPYLGLPIPGGSVLLREEEVKLRPYAEGLWGPDTFTRVDYRPDATIEKKVYGTYGPGFEINIPVSEEDLAFALPSGIMVTDNRAEVPSADYAAP